MKLFISKRKASSELIVCGSGISVSIYWSFHVAANSSSLRLRWAEQISNQERLIGKAVLNCLNKIPFSSSDWWDYSLNHESLEDLQAQVEIKCRLQLVQVDS